MHGYMSGGGKRPKEMALEGIRGSLAEHDRRRMAAKFPEQGRQPQMSAEIEAQDVPPEALAELLKKLGMQLG